MEWNVMLRQTNQLPIFLLVRYRVTRASDEVTQTWYDGENGGIPRTVLADLVSVKNPMA